MDHGWDGKSGGKKNEGGKEGEERREGREFNRVEGPHPLFPLLPSPSTDLEGAKYAPT